jgi:hypothetical protein
MYGEKLSMEEWRYKRGAKFSYNKGFLPSKAVFAKLIKRAT